MNDEIDSQQFGIDEIDETILDELDAKDTGDNFKPDKAIKKYFKEMSRPNLIKTINGLFGTDYSADCSVTFLSSEHFTIAPISDSVRGDLAAEISSQDGSVKEKLVIEIQSKKDDDMGFRILVYSMNLIEEDKKTGVWVMPKAVTLYTSLDKPAVGKDQIAIDMGDFLVDGVESSDMENSIIYKRFPFINIFAMEMEDISNSNLEMLQVLYLYMYKKNMRLLKDKNKLVAVLKRIQKFIDFLNGVDEMLASEIASNLLKDILYKSRKTGEYREELKVMDTLELTYAERTLWRGILKGREEGRQEEYVKFMGKVKNAHEKGYDKVIICDMFECSEEEVDKILSDQ